MEKLQNMEHCSWISEEVNANQYFQEYRQLLDSTLGCNFHHKVAEEKLVTLQGFFPQFATDENDETSDPLETGSRDISSIEKSCSIDKLTVENELVLPRSQREDEENTEVCSKFEQSRFVDCVVPVDAAEKLHTLKAQLEEIKKRETIGEYSALRHRLLKYYNAVRVIPENLKHESLADTGCLQDLVLSVRVQRPFYKRTHYKKACSKYPGHAQELLLLGSQKLSDLRDVIFCVNDMALNMDFSANPDVAVPDHSTTAKDVFSSSMFYISGVFYVDQRLPDAKDYSEIIKEWSKKIRGIGPLETKEMSCVSLSELKLRLGYPYLFQHLGDCEHHITFTDIRLKSPKDIQDPRQYPLVYGFSSKHSCRCFACGLRLAIWIVKGYPNFPNSSPHICDQCLKLYCYDDEGNKNCEFELFPFFDDIVFQQKKQEKVSKDKWKIHFPQDISSFFAVSGVSTTSN